MAEADPDYNETGRRVVESLCLRCATPYGHLPTICPKCMECCFCSVKCLEEHRRYHRRLCKFIGMSKGLVPLYPDEEYFVHEVIMHRARVLNSQGDWRSRSESVASETVTIRDFVEGGQDAIQGTAGEESGRGQDTDQRAAPEDIQRPAVTNMELPDMTFHHDPPPPSSSPSLLFPILPFPLLPSYGRSPPGYEGSSTSADIASHHVASLVSQLRDTILFVSLPIYATKTQKEAVCEKATKSPNSNSKTESVASESSPSMHRAEQNKSIPSKLESAIPSKSKTTTANSPSPPKSENPFSPFKCLPPIGERASAADTCRASKLTSGTEARKSSTSKSVKPSRAEGGPLSKYERMYASLLARTSTMAFRNTLASASTTSPSKHKKSPPAKRRSPPKSNTTSRESKGSPSKPKTASRTCRVSPLKSEPKPYGVTEPPSPFKTASVTCGDSSDSSEAELTTIFERASQGGRAISAVTSSPSKSKKRTRGRKRSPQKSKPASSGVGSSPSKSETVSSICAPSVSDTAPGTSATLKSQTTSSPRKDSPSESAAASSSKSTPPSRAKKSRQSKKGKTKKSPGSKKGSNISPTRKEQTAQPIWTPTESGQLCFHVCKNEPTRHQGLAMEIVIHNFLVSATGRLYDRLGGPLCSECANVIFMNSGDRQADAQVNRSNQTSGDTASGGADSRPGGSSGVSGSSSGAHMTPSSSNSNSSTSAGVTQSSNVASMSHSSNTGSAVPDSGKNSSSAASSSLSSGGARPKQYPQTTATKGTSSTAKNTLGDRSSPSTSSKPSSASKDSESFGFSWWSAKVLSRGVDVEEWWRDRAETPKSETTDEDMPDKTECAERERSQTCPASTGNPTGESMAESPMQWERTETSPDRNTRGKPTPERSERKVASKKILSINARVTSAAFLLVMVQGDNFDYTRTTLFYRKASNRSQLQPEVVMDQQMKRDLLDTFYMAKNLLREEHKTEWIIQHFFTCVPGPETETSNVTIIVQVVGPHPEMPHAVLIRDADDRQVPLVMSPSAQMAIGVMGLPIARQTLAGHFLFFQGVKWFNFKNGLQGIFITDPTSVGFLAKPEEVDMSFA